VVGYKTNGRSEQLPFLHFAAPPSLPNSQKLTIFFLSPTILDSVNILQVPLGLMIKAVSCEGN
jgi:hypothetical protein